MKPTFSIILGASILTAWISGCRDDRPTNPNVRSKTTPEKVKSGADYSSDASADVELDPSTEQKSPDVPEVAAPPSGSFGGSSPASDPDASTLPSSDPSPIPARNFALDAACTPVDIEFVNEDPNGGGAIFLKHFPDPEAAMKEAAYKVCTILYNDAKDVKKVNRVKLSIKAFDGVAFASGDAVSFSSNYIQNFANGRSDEVVKDELMGVVVHEFVHIYQYANGTPGWEVEGMADFVRLRAGHVSPNNRRKGGNYNNSYQTTAFFFAYLDDKYPDLGRKLNLAAKQWPANDQAFVQLTGKDVQTLWKEYQSSF